MECCQAARAVSNYDVTRDTAGEKDDLVTIVQERERNGEELSEEPSKEPGEEPS